MARDVNPATPKFLARSELGVTKCSEILSAGFDTGGQDRRYLSQSGEGGGERCSCAANKGFLTTQMEDT
jgi:hypothetical protein